jgi:hypothetical protein
MAVQILSPNTLNVRSLSASSDEVKEAFIKVIDAINKRQGLSYSADILVNTPTNGKGVPHGYSYVHLLSNTLADLIISEGGKVGGFEVSRAYANSVDEKIYSPNVIKSKRPESKPDVPVDALMGVFSRFSSSPDYPRVNVGKDFVFVTFAPEKCDAYFALRVARKFELHGQGFSFVHAYARRSQINKSPKKKIVSHPAKTKVKNPSQRSSTEVDPVFHGNPYALLSTEPETYRLLSPGGSHPWSLT